MLCCRLLLSDQIVDDEPLSNKLLLRAQSPKVMLKAVSIPLTYSASTYKSKGVEVKSTIIKGNPITKASITRKPITAKAKSTASFQFFILPCPFVSLDKIFPKLSSQSLNIEFSSSKLKKECITQIKL